MPPDEGPGNLANALAPTQLNGLTLRNRIIKSATFEGMSRGGRPDSRLAAHHARLAAGGVGLTTVAYAAVEPHGRTFDDQLLITDEHRDDLGRIAHDVHAEGGAVAIQLAHCGGFTKSTVNGWGRARGPSAGFNAYGALLGRPLIRRMTEVDIAEVIDAFGDAAALVQDAGFDAIELHLGHGYLLSQFLSPLTNRRRDRWGGDLEGRLRFPLAVLSRVREVVGDTYPIIAKTNLSDGLRGGSTIEDAIVISRALQKAGIDAIELSGGMVDRNAFYLLRGDRPLRAMIRNEESWLTKAAFAVFGPVKVQAFAFEPMFFLDLARRVRQAVDVPLILLGGITGGEDIQRAMDEGFDFVAMARALLSNPSLVHELARDPEARASCDHCNLCIAQMSEGVRCVKVVP